MGPLRTVVFVAAAVSAAGATLASLDISHCKLPAVSGRDDVALGFPRIANRMRSTGAVNFSILFVDFSDAPATKTPAAFMDLLDPATAYYAEMSYGAMAPAFLPLLRTLRMSQPSTAYSFATFDTQKHYLVEASALGAAAGWDFSTSDSIVVIATPPAFKSGPAFCAEPGTGFVASGRTFENGATSGSDLLVWGSRWANHELGHTMGLVDLYAFNTSGDALLFRFTGGWSLMGNIQATGNEYFGWERWLLGWVADAEVMCAGAGETSVTLVPIETPAAVLRSSGSSMRLVVAPIGPTTAVVVEARAAVGADVGIPAPGLLVYILDSSIPTGYGPLRVLPLNLTDGGQKLFYTLLPGSTLQYGSVTVQYARSSAPGTVVVELSSACSTANCFPPAYCNASGACVEGA